MIGKPYSVLFDLPSFLSLEIGKMYRRKPHFSKMKLSVYVFVCDLLREREERKREQKQTPKSVSVKICYIFVVRRKQTK